MHAHPGRRGQSGFTLIELMIAMIVGILILSASTKLLLSTMRSVTGTELRDGVDRRARFIGIALQRDVQMTGIIIDSRPTFGTIGTYADTLVMLRVPFFVPAGGGPEVPATTYARTAVLPAGAGVGNCGATCVEVVRPAGETFQINVGELAYIQLNANVRRLVRVTAVALPNATTARVTFAATNRILGHAAGVAAGGGNPAVDLRQPFTIRTLRAVAFYRDAATSTLNRVDSVLTTGAVVPQPIATGVQSWDASLIFTSTASRPTSRTPTPTPIRTTTSTTSPGSTCGRCSRRTGWMRALNNGVLLTRRYDWWLHAAKPRVRAKPAVIGGLRRL